MRRFNWTKIPQTKLQDTIFFDISDDDIQLNIKLLEEHFSIKNSKFTPAKKKEKQIKILDFKRANTVGILMTRLKIPPEEIISAMLSFDESKLSLDNTRSLYKLAPTDDEVN